MAWLNFNRCNVSSGIGRDALLLLITYEIYRRSKNNWLAAYTSQIKAEFDGVFLCRTRNPSSYFLGEFIDGKLKRELRISKEQMQWVQLGIRIQHGRKPFFYWQGSLLKVSP